MKVGDRVRMKYYDSYATGEVTIISELGVKVIFDRDFDLDYIYYKLEDLEIITGVKEDQKHDKTTSNAR